MSATDFEASALSLTIDLGALASNWRRLAAMSAPAECAAVVKANAYGIGIAPAVEALSAAGCRTFFVATLQEGRRARLGLADTTSGDAPIYVLDGFLPEWAEVLVDYELRPVLSSFASVEAWAKDGRGSPSAIQVDTGMNRLGLSAAETIELARRPDLLAAAAPQFLMSHLACADTPGHPMNAAQLARFREIRRRFPALPASLANSAGIHLGADFHFDLVRPGIALYGAAFAEGTPPLSTVVTVKARVLQVRRAEAGETVGYGATQHLGRPTRIAVVAAGYADGYHRRAGSTDGRPGASALIRGQRAPLLGRVSMDLMALDVTDIPAAGEGDWAELFGQNLPLDEVAAAADTIGYELLTQLSPRADRRYVGRTVESDS